MAACIYLFGYLPFYSVIYFSMFLLIHPSIYLFVNWERVTRIRNTLVVPTRWPGHPPRENLLYRFMNIFPISQLGVEEDYFPYLYIYLLMFYLCMCVIYLFIYLFIFLTTLFTCVLIIDLSSNIIFIHLFVYAWKA